MKKPWEWNKENLENIIGQPESLRLEFKSFRVLDKNKKDKTAEDLSKEVSAFANTEGGTLVIGIEEEKQTKTASHIVGVNPKEWPKETLQQVIESNISPPLSGIRVKPIYIDDEYSACVYVVYIPAGKTAYQAKDKCYYGRSEYECKALHDHEVRLRMFRGKSPSAKLDLQQLSRMPITSWDSGSKSMQKIQIAFRVHLKNIGEVNIREFKCVYDLYSFDSLHIPLDEEDKYSSNIRSESFSFKDGWQKPILRQENMNSIDEIEEMRVNIYPGDIFCVDEFRINVCNIELEYNNIYFDWKLYLPDQLPSEGRISVG
jgi:hypothetical protein